MENYTFSFKKERPLLKVTFPNGAVLDVFDPPVKEAEAIIDSYEGLRDGHVGEDELYAFTASVLNYNRQGASFSAEALRRELTADDVTEFLAVYAEYINSVASSKN